MYLEHKMKIIERTHNVETNEIIDIEREETVAEKKAREITQKEFAIEQAEAETKAAAKSALLAKLGITAEEAALLLS
jgi:hypothetical protein